MTTTITERAAARQIANGWHGGPGSALEEFAATGRCQDMATLLDEVRECLDMVKDHHPAAVSDVQALYVYLQRLTRLAQPQFSGKELHELLTNEQGGGFTYKHPEEGLNRTMWDHRRRTVILEVSVCGWSRILIHEGPSWSFLDFGATSEDEDLTEEYCNDTLHMLRCMQEWSRWEQETAGCCDDCGETWSEEHVCAHEDIDNDVYWPAWDNADEY